MSFFSDIGGSFDGGSQDFLTDFGGFAHDVGSIADAVNGILNPRPASGPNPGIVTLPVGAVTYGPPDPSSSNGLLLLGLVAVAAFLVLRKG